jgi:Ran GTPase-activating protein (RanGAP) involved in mRNA processing and transport
MSNRGVKKLDLSFNKFGDNAAGCRSLGELLAASSSLTSLSIGHSGVNNEGSLAIARGLLANSTLQYLDAQSNLFGSLATQAAFTQSLRSPGNALVHLIVKDCGMDAAC